MIAFLVMHSALHQAGVPGRSRLRVARHPMLWLPGARRLRWRRFEHAFRTHLATRRSSPSSDSGRSGG